MEQLRNAHKILAGKSERKRPLRRYGHRLEYNISIELRKTGFGVMN
jgi:hypothetical protein